MIETMNKTGKLVLLERDKKIRILLSDKENSAVKIAAERLASDIISVCTCEVMVQFIEASTSEMDGQLIHISTMEVLKSRDQGIVNGDLNLSALLDEQGESRWEAYLQQVIDDTLYIVGADRRGAIYGIYDLSEQIGVSPWHFWADVPVKKKTQFELPGDYTKVDWPSIPYRGVFLNDEEQLDVWSRKNTADDTIGPETYGHVFELILRLKGNYIWPAMHVNYFNGNPQNGRLAEEMGIVVGTSHCDMLLRSNQNEWDPWIEKKGYTDVKYDYSIPGRNREILQEYWRESVEMNADYEVCYTLGMRGIHDSGFITETIDSNTELNEEEKTAGKVALLEEVIGDQQGILKAVLGERRAEKAPKLFIPYKEVLDLYDQELNVPEEVTLMWVNDNFGHMRRYPNAAEQSREGGNGVYFHASYWGAPGMSYLFFNSIPLAQTGNELKKCYESGIRKMWVLNIGALKPLEIDISYFLHYAWHVGKSEDITLESADFLEKWFIGNLTEDMATEAAEIYTQFTQINNVCKLEHMASDKFSQRAYGDEGHRRLQRLKDLFDRANQIYLKLDKSAQDAFFEMVLMKIQASWYINASFYYADRSRLSYNRGAMQAADFYLSLSRKMDDKKRRMLYYYNHVIQNGKWAGILTPERFSPPTTVLYPAGKPALTIGDPELGIEVPEGVICFSSYGIKERFIEVFNKGCGKAVFHIQGPKWLKIHHQDGFVKRDKRIYIGVSPEYEKSVFDSGREGYLTISGDHGEVFTVSVNVEKREALPIHRQSGYFVEADGYIAMPADHYVEDISSGCRIIRKLGRGTGNAVEACPSKLYGEDVTASISYNFYLHSQGAFILEIYRFLTLNPTGQIRFAVSVDDHEPVIIESQITDEWRGEWQLAVMNNGEKLYHRLPYLLPGLHKIRIRMMEPYVTITKLVIYTGKKKGSNMGPDFSPYMDKELVLMQEILTDNLLKTDSLELTTDLMDDDQEQRIYHDTPLEIPLLPMLYADQKFWNIDRLYTESDERPQKCLGAIKYQPDSEGKKNVFETFGSGIFNAHNGRLAIEAEYALENSENAYLTGDLPESEVNWTHTQGETDGRSGMAMMLEGRNIVWDSPEQAPGMHYRIQLEESSNYTVWLLVKFEDHRSDACVLALDGQIQPISKQFSGKGFFTYSMRQRWNWQAVSVMSFKKGIHTFSILGNKSGLRIDRIYITKGDEWPPIDAEWEESKRV